jgi:hypothetical protein
MHVRKHKLSKNKVQWLTFAKNFDKKSPPYGFFAPMSNMTKVSFWISYFGLNHFDWVYLLVFSNGFFSLNHHENNRLKNILFKILFKINMKTLIN